MAFWNSKPDTLRAHKEKISALQAKQQDLMAQRAALKKQAQQVQSELDAAYADFDELRKDVARETGVKIGPVGVGSAEVFGKPGTA